MNTLNRSICAILVGLLTWGLSTTSAQAQLVLNINTVNQTLQWSGSGTYQSDGFSEFRWGAGGADAITAAIDGHYSFTGPVFFLNPALLAFNNGQISLISLGVITNNTSSGTINMDGVVYTPSSFNSDFFTSLTPGTTVFTEDDRSSGFLEPYPSITINVSNVPEPSAAGLFLLGGLAAGLNRKRKKA